MLWLISVPVLHPTTNWYYKAIKTNASISNGTIGQLKSMDKLFCQSPNSIVEWSVVLQDGSDVKKVTSDISILVTDHFWHMSHYSP